MEKSNLNKLKLSYDLPSWVTAEQRTAVNRIVEKAMALIDAARGVERPVIHLELRLMMRRCEVVRLTVQDKFQGVLEARGKGHGACK